MTERQKALAQAIRDYKNPLTRLRDIPDEAGVVFPPGGWTPPE